MISRLLLVLFFLAMISPSASAEKLSGAIIVKEKSDQPVGWVCYDEPTLKKIDDAQKLGIDCQVQLKKADEQIAALKKECRASQGEMLCTVETTPEEIPFYRERWFLISATAALGFGLGIGLGLSF